MPVVFDEVQANIEPETGSVTEDARKSPPKEESETKLRHLLCKLEQRSSRLRAD
jgi:hypothetical protein